jgi:Ribonuclease G/E
VTRAGAADKGPRLTARPDRLPADLEVPREAAPGLLRAAEDPLSAALASDPPPEAVVVDDPALFARLRAALAARPTLRDAVSLDSDPRPLFARAGIEEKIEALLRPRVPLPGGGDLLIEPVRSLTAIDVNSGGRDARDLRALGLAAAREVARQIRLRRLSGLIVVDFVAPREPAARREIVAALTEALADDPQPHRVSAMRRSGLVEITRRRAGPALHEVLTAPCGLDGGGRVKTAATLAFEALRALRREIAANPGRRPVLIAPAPVLRALAEGPAEPARAALEARLGKAVTLREGPAARDPEVAFES